MTDEQLLRYSRHILLDEFGIEGQQRLLDAHALVIGAGGLGSPAAMYLAAAGIGRLTLIDDDQVDLTNLQRQILHDTASIGRAKVDSAQLSLGRLNPDVRVHGVALRADAHWLDATLAGSPDTPRVDVVLDCSDNFATRQLVNRACVMHGVPLVSGAALRFDGQLASFDLRDPASPCYACLFAPDQPMDEAACSTMGVFSPIVGIIGAMQAGEAIKLISGMGDSLAGRLLMFDGLRTNFTEIRLRRDDDCSVCGHRHRI
ncbi:MAG: HesA/MoeB/ThiF family protein [Janthinobacterium lividum]